MKKQILLLIMAAVIAILLAGCMSEKAGNDGKSMNIDLKQVESITVSTQMTDPKQDVEVAGEDVKAVINKLNSYVLEPTAGEAKNGWQYLFKIEQKSGAVTLVSFMEDRVTIDESVYKVEGYNSSDFLYLFE